MPLEVVRFGSLAGWQAVDGLMMWIAISIAYIQFDDGMKARDISRDKLPYKSPLQPDGAYFAGVLCFLIVFFSFQLTIKHAYGVGARLHASLLPSPRRLRTPHLDRPIRRRCEHLLLLWVMRRPQDRAVVRSESTQLLAL